MLLLDTMRSAINKFLADERTDTVVDLTYADGLEDAAFEVQRRLFDQAEKAFRDCKWSHRVVRYPESFYACKSAVDHEGPCPMVLVAGVSPGDYDI